MDKTEQFITLKSTIEAQLARLAAHCDNHFDVASDAIGWGHVAHLEQITYKLQQVTDFTFNEGGE